DNADGIPGVARWGEKSASAVLAHYLHLEQIPDDARTWKVSVRGAPALALALAGAREDALLYRTLATLRRDAPLVEVLADLEWRGPDLPALTALARELGDDRIVELATQTHAARQRSG